MFNISNVSFDKDAGRHHGVLVSPDDTELCQTLESVTSIKKIVISSQCTVFNEMLSTPS